MTPLKQYLQEEAAKRNCKPSTIYSMIRSGRLKVRLKRVNARVVYVVK